MTFTPNKKAKNIAAKIVHASLDSDNQHILRAAEYLQEESAINPFNSRVEHKQAVITRMLQDIPDMTEIKAQKIYRVAQDAVLPYLKSGEKVARIDGLVEGLIKKASEELYQQVYNKDGLALGEQFNPRIMDSITKAAKLQVDMLINTQKNLLTAQDKAQGQGNDNKDFDLTDADRDQLERFVSGEITDDPDLIENLLSEVDESEINSAFYEVIDSE